MTANMTGNAGTGETGQRSVEWRVFLFITMVLFPVLSVLIVGGWGLLVWITQMLSGPPSY